MCGILCLIDHKFRANPFCANSDSWECRDPQDIKRIAHVDLELSQASINKLQNQDKLRELNDELIRLGNNIKTDQLVRISEIRDEIQDIIGADSQELQDPQALVDQFNALIPHVAARGPDCLLYRKISHAGKNIQLFSSILSLRQPFTTQPVRNDEYILQFNGELYNTQCEFSNDTEFLMLEIAAKGVQEAIRHLNGEFAICVIDLKNDCVWFGRDPIGKRSLSFKHTEESILVSSVPLQGYIECAGNTLYKLGLSDFKVEVIKTESEFKSLNSLSTNSDHYSTVKQIYENLKHACFIRQETIYPLVSTEANLAVLFSGGIDCTIIAALLAENFINMGNPINIDLLTVGFDNQRTNLRAEDSPDRKLSIKSWFHLAQKYRHQNISIRLVEIDIDYELWLLHKPHVTKLMYPQVTEMDLSIAIAFYFASNNIIPCKKIELTDPKVPWEQFDRDLHTTLSEYISLAKVLFSGLGADELFGGYSRHEALFASLQPNDDPTAQYMQLNELLDYDIDVIHKRNLGRDDRVISGWGKELRYPYLDKHFIKSIINGVEPNLKIKLEWTTSKKGKVIIKPIRKWILRQLAQYMGLDFVKDELKRAIQFGSKSAKLEIGQSKAKGTDALSI